MERYKISYNQHDLTTVLTHNSFSDNNNSRFIFLGQFTFKGKVAEWIFTNIAGTGTQLQHFLGGVLSPKTIENYFDKWQITKTRQAENVDISNQKHLVCICIFGLCL